MNYIQGADRHQIQLFSTCLDDLVEEHNSVRVIDLFVNTLNLQQLGFITQSPEGRPGYHPADLLKLFIYGYIHPVDNYLRGE